MSAISKTRILVVEDEEAIRIGLCDVLVFRGYEPEGIARGDEGLTRALERKHALVLLDIMLPGLDGFEVCERLRAANVQTPVLMLTARGAEEDVLRGFRCGADDYVIKPFSVAELTVRVEALLRRSGAGNGGATDPFDFGKWQVDPSALCARSDRGREVVDLTSRDVEILHLFATDRGRIVSRRRLLGDVWGFPEPERVETRSVDMHIAKLRRKLGQSGASLIETVRGEGYRHAG